MSSSDDHRAFLQRALYAASRELRVPMSDLAVEFFVNRAIDHINARFRMGSLRDQEVQNAVRTARQLVLNLRPLMERSATKQVIMNDALRYTQDATTCFYPWCKPNP